MEEKLKGLFGGGEAGDDSGAHQQPPAAAPAREGRRGGGGGRRRRRWTAEQEAQAQDFVQRYTTGHPSEGFTPDEAIGYLRQMHGEVPPEVLQRAAVATVQNLPEDQRKQFAEMLQRRQQGAGMVTIERSGQARATQGRDAAQGSGMDMDDVLGGLFGSMMGGGMGQPMPQPMPRQQAPSGGGMDDMLGGLLGTLLGGGMAQQAPQGRGAPASDPFGDILGGLLGGGMGMPAAEPEPRQRQPPRAEAGGGGIGDILGSPLGKAVLGGIAAYAMKEMMGKGRKA